MKKYIKPAFEIIELQGERMLATSPDKLNNEKVSEGATIGDTYEQNLFSNEKKYSSSDIWKDGE